MLSRNKKLGWVVLALSFVTILGTFTIASAACNTFGVTASPNPQGPDQTVTLNVTGFHDQFFNCIEGTQLDVFVKQPGQSDFPVTATGQTTPTDVNGAATFAVTATSLYDTYAVEVRWPINPTIKASTTFQVLPGTAVGTFVISPTQGQPATITAGQTAALGASGMVDANGKPVHNGTVVQWTLKPGTQDFSPCALAQSNMPFSANSTGVAGSADTATASRTTTALTIAGKYNVDALADAATKLENNAVIVTPANINSLAATAPLTARPGTSEILGANNAVDQYGNPSGPASNSGAGAKVRFSLDNSRDPEIAYPDQALNTCGAATLSHLFGAIGSDQFYGTHTWTALSQDSGAKSHTVNINVQPGLADVITSSSVLGTAVAGHNATLVANGIKDDLGFAAKSGTVVSLQITKPNSTVENLGTQTIAGVDSGQDAADVSFTIPGAAITQAGDYTALVTAEDATKSFIFEVIPDVAVVDMVLAAPNITVGDDNTVTVSGIPAGAETVDLRINRPDSTTVTLTNTAPLVDGFQGQTTFELDAADLDQLGLWGLSAIARDEDDVPVGVAAGVFTVAQRNLTVSLNTVNPDPMSPLAVDRTITVSNLPNNAPVARLVITKSDGTTITLNNNRPTLPPPGEWASGTTTFTLPKAQINKAGTWTIAATGRNAAGASIAFGNSSFAVKLPVSAPNKNLGEAGSVTVTNVPILSGATVVQLTVTKPNSSSFSLSQTPVAASNGSASFALPASSLDIAGTYNVVAAVKDGTTTLVLGGTTFKVSVKPDAIVASMNPTFVGALGGRTEVTATATKAGVPVANRVLQIIVVHVLTGTQTAHFNVATNGLGVVNQVLIGSMTQYPGDYVVTVRDSLPAGVSTTTTFHVLI